MRITLDSTKNYTPYKYDAYTKNGKPVAAPENPLYHVGDVVVVQLEDSKDLEIGVVLGCIEEESEELRVDTSGMTPFNRIRHADVADFYNPKISCQLKLRRECSGDKVTYDWNTHKLETEFKKPWQ